MARRNSVFLVTSGEGSDDDPWTLHAICTSLELARLLQEKNKEAFKRAYVETKIEEWPIEDGNADLRN